MGVVCLLFKTPGKGRAVFSGMEFWHVLIQTWVYALLLPDEVYGLLLISAAKRSRWFRKAFYPDLNTI